MTHDEMDEMEETVEQRDPFFYCVSIYEIDQQYGGPEEGGWYYHAGEPVQYLGMHTRIFQDLDSAQDYRDALRNTIIKELNEGRRPIHSVLSDGRFEVYIDEDHYPRSFPQERPYYC